MAITMVTGNEISDAQTDAHLLDDVVRGSVDFKGFPAVRSKSGCWKSASFIIGVEVAERFAYNGISSNLISYLTGPMGQSTATAAANVNAWNGSTMLVSLLCAFIADTFLGRYRAVIVASLIYILGLGLLSLSASFNSSSCKSDASAPCSPPLLRVVAFFVSLYLVSLSAGGHKPCSQAFGADQFDEEENRELKAKSSFFNWWYFSSNAGGLLALLILNYVQDNLSWALGFGIPCIVMLLALLVFLLGSMTYRFREKSDDKDSFMRIFRSFVNAPAPVEGEEAQKSTEFKFRYKAILRLVPIWWCVCLGYAIVFAQASTLFTKQGSTMDRQVARRFNIPAASLQSLISLSIMVFIPIYDRILVPIARAMTKKPAGISMLQRIGAGLFLSFLCVVVAAFVERQRLAIAREYDLVDNPKATVPMSVWWLAPQYLLYGVSEVFTMIGLQEFFYDQVPRELRSVGIALYLSVFGVGNFLSSFFISIIERATSRGGRDSWFSNNLNRAHFDYFYWLLAGLSTVMMLAYAYFAKCYIYRTNLE